MLVALAAMGYAGVANAQAPASTPPPLPSYGAQINLENAKKAAAAAAAEVAKVGPAPDAIGIVDHGAFLIYLTRHPSTPPKTVVNEWVK